MNSNQCKECAEREAANQEFVVIHRIKGEAKLYRQTFTAKNGDIANRLGKEALEQTGYDGTFELIACLPNDMAYFGIDTSSGI